MAEYPNNSHSARERTDSTAPGKAEKKLEKVVTGAAKTRKKSEARKFVNIFVPEDGENVKSYIMMDVIMTTQLFAISKEAAPWKVIREGHPGSWESW